MKLCKVDENGYFLEDVIVEKHPMTITEEVFIDENEVSEVREVYVKDKNYIEETPIGLYHPKWDGEKWIEGKVFTEEENLVKMYSEIEIEKSICETKILGGMQSDCLGETKTYSTSMNNQATIQGLVITAITNMAVYTTEVLEHKAIDEVDCYPFTEEQIMKLGVDLKTHITNCKKEAELKINEIILKYNANLIA
jgi:hypothetical protein